MCQNGYQHFKCVILILNILSLCHFSLIIKWWKEIADVTNEFIKDDYFDP